jgi:hypothetical protein
VGPQNRSSFCARVAKTVADPFGLLLKAGSHIAKRRGWGERALSTAAMLAIVSFHLAFGKRCARTAAQAPHSSIDSVILVK